ncbi:hypothetical protein ACIQZO_36050 [Streptomyces sp. NPDC097617]|uniref:hypothetical protein n=1 Tax=Streptomyces sp. NPDC097617 TaxID=3366091 RepID=UPI00380C8709
MGARRAPPPEQRRGPDQYAGRALPHTPREAHLGEPHSGWPGISALTAAGNRVQAAQADIELAAVPAHTLHVLRIIRMDQALRPVPGTES